MAACRGALYTAAKKCGFDIIAFCFMPDHLHLLAVGRESSSLPDFARLFKQLAGYNFRRARGAALWQISYFDHVVRREESLAEIAAYIWNNPVRAGLVENRMDYAFSGPRESMEQA